MLPRRLRGYGPWIVVAHGLTFLTLAALHHSTEMAELGGVGGPAVAFAIDGGLALVTVACGLWLRGADVTDRRKLEIAGWVILGSLVFKLVTALSMGVKLSEGRALSEPVFDLLLAGDVGALAGFTAGYYHADAREQAFRARRSTEAMAFVNGVLRHDLRNDLSAVAGFADLLEDQPEEQSPEEIASQAATIQETSEKALELIDSTGVLAETVIGEAELESVDLPSVLRATADRLEDATWASFEVEADPDVSVQANEGLRSVVDNLLENAVEHHDGDEPWVGITARAEGGQVVLRVADDGPGIPDEEKGRVFEPREDGTHGGGLHLVSRLVEAYGGRIRVEDRHPRGTAFVVTLPRAEPP